MIHVKHDCRHLRGDVPCAPHKQHGVRCDNCAHYIARGTRILVIKLDGIGDVIRTTPILSKLKQEHPQSEITWLTFYPDVLPNLVDRKLLFDNASMIQLLASDFDYIYNFDKRLEACALTKLIPAKTKKGFTLRDGKCAPIDEDAYHKYVTGLFDDVSKANTKNYVAEIFEIAGFPYQRQPYLIAQPAASRMFPTLKGPVVGFNTGCSSKWRQTREWSEDNWVALATQLQLSGYSVVLLGGELEHEKNLRIAGRSGAHYFGHFPLQEFMSLVNSCDVVVTAVTSTMHLALALGKKVTVFVNIFPKAEFELYDNGEFLEPTHACECYFRPTCTRYAAGSCMKTITPEMAAASVERLAPITR